jgi:putative ATP-binding cassette transporter
MVIVGAFNQVQQALRWFVDNFSGVADWRATLLRVSAFRQKFLTMDEVGKGAGRVAFDEGEGLSIRFDDLVVNPS